VCIYCVVIESWVDYCTQYIMSSSSNRIFICVEYLGMKKRKTEERKSVEILRNRGLVFFRSRYFFLPTIRFVLDGRPFFDDYFYTTTTTATIPRGDGKRGKIEVISFSFLSFFPRFMLYIYIRMNLRSSERCNKRVNSFKGVTIK